MSSSLPIRRRSEDQKLIVELDRLIAKFVKDRDGWTCLKCGRRKCDGWFMNAAHILTKKRYSKIRFLPENIMTLCVRCHMEWHDGETDWFYERFPKRRDDLLAKNKLAGKVDLKLLLSIWRRA